MPFVFGCVGHGHKHQPWEPHHKNLNHAPAKGPFNTPPNTHFPPPPPPTKHTQPTHHDHADTLVGSTAHMKLGGLFSAWGGRAKGTQKEDEHASSASSPPPPAAPAASPALPLPPPVTTARPAPFPSSLLPPVIHCEEENEEEEEEWQDDAPLSPPSSPPLAAHDDAVGPVLHLALGKAELKALCLVVTFRKEQETVCLQKLEKPRKGGEREPGEVRAILQALGALLKALSSSSSSSSSSSLTHSSKLLLLATTPTTTSSSSPSSSTRKKLAVDVDVLLQSMRALLALSWAYYGTGGEGAKLRAALLRATRYLLLTAGTRNAAAAVQRLESVDRLRLDVFVIRSLERGTGGAGAAGGVESSYHWDNAVLGLEKLEALKLLRTVFALHHQGGKPRLSSSPLNPTASAIFTLLMSLVAVCGHKEGGGGPPAQPHDDDVAQNFRRLALETLREVAVSHTELVTECQGIRPLVEAVLEPPMHTLAEPILLTLLSLLDGPSTRRVFSRQPLVDLQLVLSPWTNLDMLMEASPERAALLACGQRALKVLLRTWTGVAVLASDTRKGLKALVVGVLGDDSVDMTVRLALFAVLDEVLRPLLRSFFLEGGEAAEGKRRRRRRRNLLDGFFSYLLAVLLHCGLLDALTNLAVGPNVDLTQGKASSLLVEIMGALPTLLFADACLQHMTMPSLVAMCDAAALPPPPPAGGWNTGAAAAAAGGGTIIKGMRPFSSLSSIDARLLSLRASDLLRRLCHAELSSFASSSRRMQQLPSSSSFSSSLLLLRRGSNGDRRRSSAASALPFLDDEEERERGGGGGSSSADVEQVLAVVKEQVWGLRQHQQGPGRRRRQGDDDKEEEEATTLLLLLPSLHPTPDKATLEALLTRSKVLAIKDPPKWDWEAIHLLLNDTLTHPPHLLHVLKHRPTFFRRLGDCFRLGGGERGFAPDLPWESTPLRMYLPVLCGIYRVLSTTHPDGLAFLQAEPRVAKVLQDLASLLQLTAAKQYTTTTHPSSRPAPHNHTATSPRMQPLLSTPSSSTSTLPLLDPMTCARSFTRAYISLLGSLLSSSTTNPSNSLDLLKTLSPGLLPTLRQLRLPELSYLARLLLLHLDAPAFAAGGVGRDLLQGWLPTHPPTPKKKTDETLFLRLTTVNVLRALLLDRSRRRGIDEETEAWALELLLHHAHSPSPTTQDAAAVAALAVLEDVAGRDPSSLPIIARKFPSPPPLSRAQARERKVEGSYYRRMQTLFLRLAGCESGLAWLEKTGWVGRLLGEQEGGWGVGEKEGKGELYQYVPRVQRRLVQAFRPSSSSSSSSPPPIVIKCSSSSSSSFSTFLGSSRDLRTLLSLPWSIHLQSFLEITTPLHGRGGEGRGLVGLSTTSHAVELLVDTCVDATSFSSSSSTQEEEKKYGGRPFLRLKGLLLDPSTGKPSPHTVGRGQSLRACVRLGNAFLDRQGKLTNPFPSPASVQPTPSSSFLAEKKRKGSNAAMALSQRMKHHLANRQRRDSSSPRAAAAAAQQQHLSSCGDLMLGSTTPSSSSLFEDRLPSPAFSSSSSSFLGLAVDEEEYQADWSVCRPQQRRRSSCSSYQVATPDDPATWTFKKQTTSLPPPPVRKCGTPTGTATTTTSTLSTARSTLRRSSSPEKRSTVNLRSIGEIGSSSSSTAGVGGGVTPQSSSNSRERGEVALVGVEFVLAFDKEEEEAEKAGVASASMPLHAYAELVKTEKGCRLLRESGMLSRLLAQSVGAGVEEKGEEEEEEEKKGSGTKARGGGKEGPQPTTPNEEALLWALGHACSTQRGLQAVLEAAPQTIHWLTHTAETHPRLSVRGTGLCVLGLVAGGEGGGGGDLGRQQLAQHGWVASSSHTGLALPVDIRRMLCLPSSSSSSSSEESSLSSSLASSSLTKSVHPPTLSSSGPFPTPSRYSPSPSPATGVALAASLPAQHQQQQAHLPSPLVPETPTTRGGGGGGGGGGNSVEDEVMGLIIQMSNYVTRKEAQLRLIRLRRKPRYRRKFTSLRFYLRVQELLGQYSFRLPVRRFLTELFAEVDLLSTSGWENLKERQQQEQEEERTSEE